MSDDLIVHATCVAWHDKAVLIQGASGNGKSALGLILLGMGCVLIADDRVILQKRNNAVRASSPPTIRNMIESRGIGILNASSRDNAMVTLVVDLDQIETARLPLRREVTLLGTQIPLIHRVDGPHFAASILQLLKAGWSQR